MAAAVVVVDHQGLEEPKPAGHACCCAGGLDDARRACPEAPKAGDNTGRSISQVTCPSLFILESSFSIKGKLRETTQGSHELIAIAFAVEPGHGAAAINVAGVRTRVSPPPPPQSSSAYCNALHGRLKHYYVLQEVWIYQSI